MVWFLIVEFAVSHSFRRCISEPADYRGAEGSYKYSRVVAVFIFRQGICSLRLIDAHNGFFALLGTIAVAFFTFTLWRSTDRLWQAAEDQREADERARERDATRLIASLDAAQKTANAAHSAAETAEKSLLAGGKATAAINRPYMVIHDLNTITTRVDIGGVKTTSWTIMPRFKNVGNTPAKRVKAFMGYTLTECSGLPSDFTYASNFGATYWPDIGAGDTRDLIRFSIPADVWAAVVNDTKWYFVYGAMEYSSVFEPGRRFRTEFCARVTHVANEATGTSIAGTNYGPHNGTDEDCHLKPETT